MSNLSEKDLAENAAVQHIKEYLSAIDGMSFGLAIQILEITKLDIYTQGNAHHGKNTGERP